MAKYIDADRLRAEIERRKQSLRAGICSDGAFTKEQKKEMLVASEEIDRFNRIVTSLQQEQPVSEDLEEAGAQYVKTYFRDIDWTPDVIKLCLEEAFISGGEYVFKQIKDE